MKKIIFIFLVSAFLLLQTASIPYAVFGVSGGGGCWQTGSDGWTVICSTPITTGTCSNSSGTADGTCFIAVASSGVAGCSAFSTQAAAQAAPCDTIEHGQALMRLNKPDHLLLNKGDTFTLTGGMDFRFISGLSATAPQAYLAYGSGVRPIVLVSNSVATGFAVNGSVIDYVALIGWDFYASQRDPNNASFLGGPVGGACVNWGSLPFHFFLVEDVKCRFFNDGIDISTSNAASASGLTIRRNIIVDSYVALVGPNFIGHSQGSLISDMAAGWVINENVYDHNGWNETLTANVTATITQASPGVVSFALSLPSGSFTPPNGSTIQFTQSGGGITAGTNYITLNKSGGTFQISTDGVTPINTSAGLISPQTANWVDAQPTVFNRNVYVSESSPGKGTFNGNISTRSASEGIQMRPGGDMFNNLYAYNIQAFTGGNSQQADTTKINYFVATYNVVQSSGNLHAFPEVPFGNGAVITNSVAGTVQVNSNIFLKDISSPSSGTAVDYATDVVGGLASSNIVFVYHSGILSDGIGGITSDGYSSLVGGSGYNNGTFEHVILTGGAGTGGELWVTVSGGAVVSILTRKPGQNYVIGDVLGLDNTTGGMSGVGSGFSVRVAQVGTTTTGSLAPNCVDLGGTNNNPGGACPAEPFSAPTRTIETYDSSVLGGPGTFADFIAKARLQSKDNWNPALTACAVNNYIRAGFGVGAQC